jgi:mono/diheme cytochrome c family protein
LTLPLLEGAGFDLHRDWHRNVIVTERTTGMARIFGKGAAAGVILGVAVWIFWPSAEPVPVSAALASEALVAVTVPFLAGEAAQGASLFEAHCAACHGKNGAGRDGAGPPLIHRIYEPSHHGDAAFYLAAQNGVRAHHWRFGNMPPVKDVSEADVAKIITYIRAVQRANGIE